MLIFDGICEGVAAFGMDMSGTVGWHLLTVVAFLP